MESQNELTLGIDIGTSSIKVALVANDRSIVNTKTRDHNANVRSDAESKENEQDASKILSALQICLSGLPKEQLVQVRRIGVTGQMHGIIYWKQSQGWTQNACGRYEIDTASHLITWQDARCSEDFIASLPSSSTHQKLATGMGVVTTLWFAKYRPDALEKYDRAGTIQDFVVCMLCNLDTPMMTYHNACSWGYFDSVTGSWNTDTLKEAGFPSRFLPEVRAHGPVGALAHAWYNIAAGVSVSAAMGDFQCTFLAMLPQVSEAVLNISTSAQLAFMMPESFAPAKLSDNPEEQTTIDYFPYFNGRYLAVAASLNGGNVLSGFIKMLQLWTHELGHALPVNDIWTKVNSLANESQDCDLIIDPILFGERHKPLERGSVRNITSKNTSLGNFFSGISRGLIANLHSMMSREFLSANDITRILASGTAIAKNAFLAREIERQYQLPVTLSESKLVDAAMGAALAVLDDVTSSS